MISEELEVLTDKTLRDWKKGFISSVRAMKKLYDCWCHAPDEIGGTDEGAEGSGSGPEAVNEPES